MSEIEMKIKEKTKDLEEICDKLSKKLNQHLTEDMQNADTHEVGSVADAIKDIAEAKEKAVKCMYYHQLMEAMSDNEYGEDYDEDGPLRGYRGRSARTGRFVHRGYEERMMSDRDMDRSSGRMYYAGTSTAGTTTGGYNKGYEDGRRMGYEEGHERGYQEGMNRGYREAGTVSRSRYENARRGFEETHDEQSGADQQEKMQALQEMLNSMTEELQPKILKMNQQEKQYTKNTLQALINKI